MIAFVKGILEDIYEDRAVIDVNGMGINVMISPYTASMLPQMGEQVKLYTYTVVREDAFHLYGFLEKSELDLFCRVITVNGIGPKGGLAILSYLGADGLVEAIIDGDVQRISKTPGIGKKSAEKMIIDLQDKIKNDFKNASDKLPSLSKNEKDNANLSDTMAEAVLALTALGYQKNEAKDAVMKTSLYEENDTETVLKEALKYLV